MALANEYMLEELTAEEIYQRKLTAGSNITINEQNVISAANETYSDFVGATVSTDGVHGLVPAPVFTDRDKYLKGDGTWAEIVTATAMSELTDVQLTNLANGQILQYNATAQRWRNVDIPFVPEEVLYIQGAASTVGGNYHVIMEDYSAKDIIEAYNNHKPVFIVATGPAGEYGDFIYRLTNVFEYLRSEIGQSESTPYYKISFAHINANDDSNGIKVDILYMDVEKDSTALAEADTLLYTYDRANQLPDVSTGGYEGYVLTVNEHDQWDVKRPTGGLSANELTEEAYNALTPAQKTNGDLYLTHPATVGSSEPNKIYYNNTLYGTEGGNDVVELTQAEWDALPSSKLTDGIIYVITDGGGGGGASAISDLTDVELTNLADGEILKYDATTEKWVNAVESGGGSEAVYKTLAEYEALPTADKEDPTKIYFVINEGSKVSPTLSSNDGNCSASYVTGYEWRPLSGDVNTELSLVNGGLAPGENCWWCYHFDNRKQFSKVNFSVIDQGIGLRCYIQASNDGSTWVNILNNPSGYEEIASRVKTKYEFPLNTNGVNYEYFRIYFYRTTEAGGVIIAGDTEIYAAATSSRPLIYYKNILYTEYELPNVTISDAGKVLIVNEDGVWNKGDIREVPAITLSDEEKILTVESGSATWASPKKITHLYDVIPLENPLYRIGSITPSTSPVTIDMTQITPNYSELLSTDFEFVFMQDESDLCMRAWYGNPIDNTPGTFSYTPSTGELIATLRGGFTGGQFGIVYKKSVIQISQPALVSGSTATIDCSDIPNAETLTVADFALVITNVYEPSTSNNGNISLGYSFSYDQTTKTFSGYVGAGTSNQLTVSGYFIVANYGDPEYRLITDFQGASASSDGYHGFVPAPLITDRANFLRGDGTWAEAQGASAVSDLTDVELTNLADKEILEWDAVAEKWKNKPNSGGGGTGGSSVYTCDLLIDQTIKAVGNYNFSKDISEYDAVVIAGDAWRQSSSSDNKSMGITMFIPKEDYLTRYVQDGWGFAFTYQSQRTTFNIDVTNNCLEVGYVDVASNPAYINKVYGLKFGTLSPIIYSEEEREVGVWIDNKPLYSKVFTFSSPTTFRDGQSVDITNLIDLSFVEQFVNSVGIGIVSTEEQDAPINVFKYNNKIYAQTSIGIILDKIWIQYTKTTDVAGSGKYNTLGVPMTHIDESEQVIGTLFGETLYQKSFQTTVTIASTARAWYTLLTSSQLRIINADKVLIDATHSFIELNDSIINLNYSSIVNAAGGTAGCSYASTEDEVQVCLYGFVAGTYPATVTIQYTKTTD